MLPRKMSARRFISSRSLPAARTLTSISSRSMWFPSVRSTTLTTSTSLFSCFVICSMMSSEPAVTIVIRDIVVSSVGATVSDSMLYPRAEKSPEMRDSAPASFSTRIERMCLISQFLRQDHLGQPLAAGHHREDVLGLVGDEVEEHEPVLELERLLERALDVAGLLDLEPDVPVGLGELHEVGQRVHVRLRVAVAVKELLPLPHHPHVPVVEVHDLDRQVVLLAGRELLDAHLDRRLARHADDGRLGVDELDTHRGREPEAHCAEAARVDPAAGLVELVVLRDPH